MSKDYPVLGSRAPKVLVQIGTKQLLWAGARVCRSPSAALGWRSDCSRGCPEREPGRTSMRAVPHPSLRIALVAAATLAIASTGLASAVAPFSAPINLGLPTGDDWEPAIAADSTGHVYAVWSHYVGYGGGSSGEPDPSCPDCASPHTMIRISNDYGASWGPPHALVNPSPNRQDDPQIVVDADDGDTVYAAFMQNNKSSMYVAKSTNHGATFTPVLVEDIERGLDKIALAARDGDVYLVYHSQEKIFASISHDAGVHWTTTQPVKNTNSKLGVSLPSGAAIAPDGTAYFAWNGANKPGQAKGTKNLYLTKTIDGGDTWTTLPVAVSAPAPRCDCGGWDFWGPQMAVGVDGAGALYVLYNLTAEALDPQRMYFRKSVDGGDTWTTPPVDVSLAPNGSNNLFPALVAGASGDVRVAWMDDRNGFDSGGNDPSARWNTYYRSSTDGGATWSSEAQLSAFVANYSYKFNNAPHDGFLQPYGDYFEIDIDGHGDTVAIWGEGTSYFGPGNVWFAHQ